MLYTSLFFSLLISLSAVGSDNQKNDTFINRPEYVGTEEEKTNNLNNPPTLTAIPLDIIKNAIVPYLYSQPALMSTCNYFYNNIPMRQLFIDSKKLKALGQSYTVFSGNDKIRLTECTINLDECCQGDISLIVEQLPIEELKLCNNNNIGIWTQIVDQLCETILKNNNITSLYLMKGLFVGMNNFCFLFKNNKMIRSLTMDDSAISDEKFEKLLSTINTSSSIKKLDLSNNIFTKQDLNGLSSNTNLETIRLSNCRLQDHALPSIIAFLRNRGSALKHIDLSRNSFSQQSIDSINELKKEKTASGDSICQNIIL